MRTIANVDMPMMNTLWYVLDMFHLTALSYSCHLSKVVNTVTILIKFLLDVIILVVYWHGLQNVNYLY